MPTFFEFPKANIILEWDETRRIKQRYTPERDYITESVQYTLQGIQRGIGSSDWFAAIEFDKQLALALNGKPNTLLNPLSCMVAATISKSDNVWILNNELPIIVAIDYMRQLFDDFMERNYANCIHCACRNGIAGLHDVYVCQECEHLNSISHTIMNAE